MHLSYVRQGTGHALIGARQWIPREHIADPARSLAAGLPPGLRFRTKGQLAIDICADAYADGVRFDFICGDEVYGSSTGLREFLESRGQAYVLRVASNFTLTPATGTKLTCAQAAKRLLKDEQDHGFVDGGQLLVFPDGAAVLADPGERPLQIYVGCSWCLIGLLLCDHLRCLTPLVDAVFY